MSTPARGPDQEVPPDGSAGRAELAEAAEPAEPHTADEMHDHADRPAWWTQVALIVAGLWIYDYIANLSPLRRAAGLANATAILRLEKRLHLNPELALNEVLIAHQRVGRVLADYYNLAHFVITLSILAWIYWRHPSHFRMLRNSLIVMNAIGLVVYWLYPVAPPRMLPALGYVDIGVITHSFGSATQNATIAAHANEFAAMPSLHVAWALWCVFAVWTIWRSGLARGLVIVHTLLTGTVIMATANHYFLDVVAGAATGAVGIIAATAWAARRDRRLHYAPGRCQTLGPLRE
ncbi:MAG: phosphatase PAP2 family protein [Actinomycetota bacterium]|nr:phosphatase PAP2 family protein [Actinomycetota bacterium]